MATQDPELVRGLVVKDKKQRVANFHDETVKGFIELMAAAGLKEVTQINRSHIYRRISFNQTQRMNEIFPYLEKGCLLKESDVPQDWLIDWKMADAERFV